MQHRGPRDVGEYICSNRASSRPPALSVYDRHKASEHAQDVQGSAKGPSRRSEAPSQIDLAVLMAMLTAFQGSKANITTLLERQSSVNNPIKEPLWIFIPIFPHKH